MQILTKIILVYNRLDRPRIQAVLDFDMLTGPLSAWELSCVEMGDIVCTRAYILFDLIYLHFPHVTNLKCIFPNVKINYEYIGGVVFAYMPPMGISF